jgi:hypothetical protein
MAARLHSCRPGYSFIVADGSISAECRDGRLIQWADLSDTLRDEARLLAGRAGVAVGSL